MNLFLDKFNEIGLFIIGFGLGIILTVVAFVAYDYFYHK